MQREAERALASYGRPVQRALPGPVRGAPNQLAPITTAPDAREMCLRIECQCGRAGEVLARPVEFIARQQRCTGCGEVPEPF
jgi:hypothetical protein